MDPSTGIETLLTTLPFAHNAATLENTWLDPYANIIYSQKDSNEKIYAYDIAYTRCKLLLYQGNESSVGASSFQ